MNNEGAVNHGKNVALQADLLGDLGLLSVALGDALQCVLLAPGLHEEDRAEAALAQQGDGRQPREFNLDEVYPLAAPALCYLDVILGGITEHPRHAVVGGFTAGGAEEILHELSSNDQASHAFGPRLRGELRHVALPQDHPLAKVAAAPVSRDLLADLLASLIGRFYPDYTGPLLDDVEHQVVVVLTLGKDPVACLELQDPGRVACELAALRLHQRGQQVDLVQELQVLLQLRALAAEGLLEVPAADGEYHGVLNGLKRRDQPGVVEQRQLTETLARAQGRDGDDVLRGPHVLHPVPCLARRLEEVHDELAVGPRAVDLRNPARVMGQAVLGRDNHRDVVADAKTLLFFWYRDMIPRKPVQK
mmetsp:Transcript_53917/g.167087  ORF Transcript_53917/g.167087 Transcript_53917/m.167087 type:complete len:362 (-) Transcript_53917:211-1296(-)